MKIEFRSAEFKLAGLLDLPNGDAKMFAVIAACFTCSKNSKTSAYLARALARHGIACLRLDFRGLGESEGEFVDNTLTSNISDLVAAANFLAADHEAPKLFIGHSFGGLAVTRAARQFEPCRGVVVVNSPADPRHVTSYFPERLAEIRAKGSAMIDIAGRPFPIGRAFLEDVDGDQSTDALAKLGKPILICHSPEDDVVPIAQAEKAFHMAGQPKSFISLEGTDHFLSKPGDTDNLANFIASWTDVVLR